MYSGTRHAGPARELAISGKLVSIEKWGNFSKQLGTRIRTVNYGGSHSPGRTLPHPWRPGIGSRSRSLTCGFTTIAVHDVARVPQYVFSLTDRTGVTQPMWRVD